MLWNILGSRINYTTEEGLHASSKHRKLLFKTILLSYQFINAKWHFALYRWIE
jgi:hypothetical protein